MVNPLKKTYLALSLLLLLPTMSGAENNGVEITLKPVFNVSRHLGKAMFRTPQAVCVDAERGDIYVADTNEGRVVVLNSDGQVLTTFKHHPSADVVGEPVGVAVDKLGEVYVTDSSSHTIFIYDIRGRLTGRFTAGDQYKDALYGRMTIDSADNLYVVARNKDLVFLFDPDHVLKHKIGDAGSRDGERMISDVAVDAKGCVYTVSSLGVPVRKYSAKGVPLLQFGEHAPGAANVSFPTAIDVDAKGRIWLTDSFAQSIKIYSDSGAFLMDIGGFIYPVDTAFWQKENRISVLEKGAQRLQCYAIEVKGGGS